MWTCRGRHHRPGVPVSHWRSVRKRGRTCRTGSSRHVASLRDGVVVVIGRRRHVGGGLLSLRSGWTKEKRSGHHARTMRRAQQGRMLRDRTRACAVKANPDRSATLSATETQVLARCDLQNREREAPGRATDTRTTCSAPNDGLSASCRLAGRTGVQSHARPAALCGPHQPMPPRRTGQVSKTWRCVPATPRRGVACREPRRDGRRWHLTLLDTDTMFSCYGRELAARADVSKTRGPCGATLACRGATCGWPWKVRQSTPR